MRTLLYEDDILIQTCRPKNPEFHVVIVESGRELVKYNEGTGKSAALTGEMYGNLTDEWCYKYNMGVMVSIVTVLEDEIGENTLKSVYKTLKSLDIPISMENTGFIIADKRLGQTIHPKPFEFLNVILPIGESDSGLPVIPFKSSSNWLISIPTYQWAVVGGNVKADGAGINLLGFIHRGVEALINGQTEASIAAPMRAYHKGKFTETVFVDTPELFADMLEAMQKSVVLSLDTEATSVRRIGNTLISLQILTSTQEVPNVDRKLRTWFLPFEHPESPWDGKQLLRIKKKLKVFFENQAWNQLHIYQFAKFDLHQLMDALKLRFYSGDVYDTAAGSFSLEENQKILKNLNVSPYTLEHLETTFEYVRPKDLVIGKADRGRMIEFSLIDIMKYGTIDIVTPYFIACEQVRVANQRGYPDFLRFVRYQIGPMLIATTIMEHVGIPIDLEYLADLASPMGSFAEMIRASANAIATTAAAKKTNTLLLSETSYQSRGMFGEAAEPQMFNIRKVAHLQKMFFDVLNLDVVDLNADGTPSLNARFQKANRHKIDVAQYTDYQKLNKLKTAFADAIYEFLQTHPDMKDDKRLRPIFTYLDVLTGRSSTIRPSSQQLPTHGKRAKIIKQQFRANYHRLRILGKTDFSAHEVRVSGNLSRDENIIASVDAVNHAQHQYRVASIEDLPAAKIYLDDNGDIHCLSGDSLIATEHGDIKIKDLSSSKVPTEIDIKVQTPFGLKTAYSFIPQGVKKTYMVNCSDESNVTATDNHKFAVYSNGEILWKELKDLKAGDQLLKRKHQ